ncbi:hypothetical protein OSTOST_01994 [Ostertagia ostertagi]
MSSANPASSLKGVKQKLTRQLNNLNGLIIEALDYQAPWQFPVTLKEILQFLATKTIMVQELHVLYQETVEARSNTLTEIKSSDEKETIDEFDETGNQRMGKKYSKKQKSSYGY